MRWTLTSPDGLGDFLLRLPWLFAMEARGWELQLLAREATIEAAKLAGLSCECVVVGESPYSKRARSRRQPFATEFDAVRRFQPNLIFFGPSQPTFFEEEAVRTLEGVRTGGFVVMDEFWPSEGISDPRDVSRVYSVRVEVKGTDAEPERNARAAGILLGEAVPLEPFHFPASTFSVVNPRVSGDYIVVSPGYRAGDYFKGWGDENWSRELRLLEDATDKKFVFVGGAGEREANAAIFARLKKADRHLDLTGVTGTVCELGSLLAGATAYVGKDSGAMHLAAALRRPVLATFGGGHGRRFYPVGTRAVVLTVDVPCRGCDWRCHLEEPLCLRDLGTGSLVRGWELLNAAGGAETIVIEQAPSAEARRTLEMTPQDSYPQRTHALRKSRLQAERRDAMQPLPVRLWSRFAGGGR